MTLYKMQTCIKLTISVSGLVYGSAVVVIVIDSIDLCLIMTDMLHKDNKLHFLNASYRSLFPKPVILVSLLQLLRHSLFGV